MNLMESVKNNKFRNRLFMAPKLLSGRGEKYNREP